MTATSESTLRLLAQHGHDVRLDWGESGLAVLAQECAVLVLVDVLSFSTRVDLAIATGRAVRPEPWTAEPSRADESGDAERLRSPNGAALSLQAATSGARVLTACLRNAEAVARAAADLAAGSPIGVLAAGERWGVDLTAEPGVDGPLRPCVEDHLGAGAVVAGLQTYGAVSPEAVIAAQAFAVADVPAAVTGSASGRELAAHGDEDLVAQAVEVGVSGQAPLWDPETGVFTGA
ncbi:2-phosphosulfolactate phosphatase [Prauserella rugosa]|uniref:Probable 2-phosphosulfolactate phosphatase n=1 Tax=Prauserella rugosa TaxID=43354 RepID=A0A660C7P2_9PSEU|nr:2-phosphosulfolactate phosphatase [Prauserella rugosa]KMS91389.1 hypothetical protein ACZ91_09885 [Streptomyces regensis]TWH18404.1 2-phosphosulfolactate phosphatase [Prauserella rugosa]